MAVLRDKDAVIGWLAADNLLTGRPLEGAGRGRLVLYAQIVSNLIAHMRYAESLESGIAARTAELRSRAKSLSELYEKADAQNSLKERLFTIIAHDLRGPIGAIRSLLATIAKDSGSFSDQELRSYVPEMLKSVDSVYGLLDNLLAWVRSQMDEIKVLRERIDLEALFEGVIATQRATAGAKGVGISMAVPRGSHVFSDRRIAEAILRNFLSNAIKFTPAGKEVSLRARQSREVMATYIEVSDEGRGMDERTLALLFTMDDDKKRVGTAGERGNGIGLVFCRDLAERLGGRIEAKSRPGLGSSFTLVLPDVFEDELPVLG
jgi:signal transduction histidine kinase